MRDHQAEFPVATMCRLLAVSPRGFYASDRREPSARTRQNVALSAAVQARHAASDGFGAHGSCAVSGIGVGQQRVARLMRAADLAGVSRRKWVTTTMRRAAATVVPDLVERNFTAPARASFQGQALWTRPRI